MTKNRWFMPFIVICAAVILVIITFAVLKKKSPAMGATTTTKTTTAIVTTQAQQTVTITPPPTTVIQTQTITPPPSTTTETDTVTKTSVITPGTTVTTTVTTPVTTSVTTTITPTTTVIVTATTTPVITTTLPVVTTTATVTTTVVTPAMTFSTGLAVDGSTLAGQTLQTASGVATGTFTVTVGGNSSTPAHILTLSGANSSTPLLTACPFYLVAGSLTSTQFQTEQQSLISYFTTVYSGNSGNIQQMAEEINGTVPYFYISATNDLVDGFKWALGNTVTAFMLRDDFPQPNTLTFDGTLIGSNHAVLPMTITLVVK